MASIATSIELYDRVSAPVFQIVSALQSTVRAFQSVNNAMENGMDTASIEQARQEIDTAISDINGLQTAIQQVNNETIAPAVDVPAEIDVPHMEIPTPDPVDIPVNPDVPSPVVPDPEPVTVPVEWQTDNLEVFTSSGVERFEQEIQSANSMMQRLQQNQERIQQAASRMDILPDTAISDINGIASRLTSLQGKLTQLERTPVSLRTTEVNNQIEVLRSQLVSAIQSQNDLNQALDNMDASAANAAYQQLSQTISGTERFIRNNEDRQQDFNDAIGHGVQQSNQLMDTIKRAVAAYISIQSIKKAMDVSDELVSTTARLNTMNSAFNEINGTVMQTDDLVYMVYQAAQDARGSFADMASVVAKFGNNARDAFSSQQEVVDFANLIQKQMTIAGASTAEASNAMLQLSQALGSGTLRGDELNSIFEQAPNLIQSIADYLDVPIGKIREMASEGQISADIVKNAIFAASDDINAQFAAMPMTWNQVWTSMTNTALIQFQPVLDKINELANNEQFQTMMIGVMDGLSMMAMLLLNIMEFAGSVASFFQSNWSIIAPIVMGIVAALTAYMIVAGIVNTINGIMAAMEGVKAAAQMMAAGATFAETAAQYGLNAALAACPLTWIIALIIALIAVIFAVCQAIAKMTGVANSGFGVICGGVNVVIAFFKNLGLSIANIALGIGNAIAALGSNIMTAFHNAIAHVQEWWYNLLSTVLNVIAGIAEALNKLPFVEFDYSGVSNAADEYAAKAAEAAGSVQEYQSIGDAFNKGFSTFDTFQDGWAADAFNAGAEWGDGVMDGLSSMLDGFGDLMKTPEIDNSTMFDGAGYTPGEYGGYDASQIPSNISDTAGNTARTADALEITDEDLKYLRDIAERDFINRFTTAEISVNLGGVTNNVNDNVDLDGMIDYLASNIQEAMEVTAEGVHV